MSAAAPALAMLAGFLLAGGGARQLRRGERLKGVLMLAMALVLFGNVAIVTL